MRSSRRLRGKHPQYRKSFIYGGGLLLALLSALAISQIRVMSVWPDVTTVYVLFFTLFGNPKGRYGPCMAIGFLRDLFSGGPLGTYAILYGLLHRMLSPQRQALFRENPLTQMVLAGVVVFGVNLGYHASMVVIGAGVGWSFAVEHAVRIATVTAPLFPLLCFGMVLALTKLDVARLPGGNYNV